MSQTEPLTNEMLEGEVMVTESMKELRGLVDSLGESIKKLREENAILRKNAERTSSVNRAIRKVLGEYISVDRLIAFELAVYKEVEGVGGEKSPNPTPKIKVINGKDLRKIANNKGALKALLTG